MARTRLNWRGLCCAALALLLSLLSFASVLQAGHRWSAGNGVPHSAAAAVLSVQLLDAEAQANPPAPATTFEAAVPAETLALHDTAATHAGPAVADQPALAYVPVEKLSERPSLLQDIDPLIDLASAGIAGPSLPSLSDVTGLLLINEHGYVDRLQFESDELPHYLQTTLAQRFAGARFIPGKIDGTPVRSALRIALRLQ